MTKPRRSLRDPNRPPVHPAEILREDVLPSLGMSKSEFAMALGISRQMLHGILTEKHPVTVEMAVKLGHVLGNGPGIWIRMQQAHDLWHAERKVDLSKLKVLSAKDKAA
jgi:addiction module HigA family antidote